MMGCCTLKKHNKEQYCHKKNKKEHRSDSHEFNSLKTIHQHLPKTDSNYSCLNDPFVPRKDSKCIKIKIASDKHFPP